MSLLSVVQSFGQTLLTTKNTSSFSMRNFGWALPYPTHLSPEPIMCTWHACSGQPLCLLILMISPLDSYISIPLHTVGTVIYTDTQAPTQLNLNHCHILCSHLMLIGICIMFSFLLIIRRRKDVAPPSMQSRHDNPEMIFC